MTESEKGNISIVIGAGISRIHFKAIARVGDVIVRGTLIGIYSLNSRANFSQQLLAPFSGRLSWVCDEAQTDLFPLAKDSRIFVAQIDSCSHAIIYQGACAECGESELGAEGELIYSNISGLRTPGETAARPQLERLQSARKLILVFDLDHTLIHAQRLENDIPPGDFARIELGNAGMFAVKFRPFLHKMLRELAPLFEIFVYTFGTRDYAMAVLKLINASEKLIDPRRMVTRDESLKGFKELEKIIPTSMLRFCVIVDDLDIVWPEHKNRLLKVEPFHYFDSLGKPREECFDCDLHFLTQFLISVHLKCYENESITTTEVKLKAGNCSRSR